MRPVLPHIPSLSRSRTEHGHDVTLSPHVNPGCTRGARD
ncbi:protein of unknown function [Cupriavidus neocaledonicus]|uniref:Uncharacterized protein n=1 Tax=Cupriavidus neocaledonicus TaxID=1040979 RepID=A0A375H2C3_9BURK|nr:hypothetical protein CBM2605_A10033 [Cupriavidus neocaledonicus]SPD45076.1 protein of unknown function [Cupriavidus neocaledonicus]